MEHNIANKCLLYEYVCKDGRRYAVVMNAEDGRRYAVVMNAEVNENKHNKKIYLCDDDFTIEDVERLIKHEKMYYDLGIERDKLGVYIRIIYNVLSQSYEIIQVTKQQK